MKVGVIGINYIGGSIIKSLANQDVEITGVTGDIDYVQFLNSNNCTITDDMTKLNDCEIIFICMDVVKTLGITDRLKEIVSNDCIVCDVLEVKDTLLQNSYPFSFIGTHPLIKNDKKDVKASCNDLFNNIKWLITPKEEESKEKILKLEQLILKTGAIPFVIDSKTHDKIMAKTNHLPLLVAQALAKTIINDKEAFKLRTDMFNDIVKHISINPSTAKNNLQYNKENIDKAVVEFENTLNELKNSAEQYFNSAIEINNTYNKISEEILRKEKFEKIFKQNYWGSNESISGPASNLAQTVQLRNFLPKLIAFKDIKSIIDVPCGDMNWFSTINLEGVKYWGFDIVEDLIKKHQETFKDKPNYEFAVKDAITDNLPQADLILCRDLIIHFPIMAIYDLLQNFIRSGSKYLLITQHSLKNGNFDINTEIGFGEFAFRNLTEPPFNLPQAELLIPEDQFDDRCIRYMALYEIEQLDKALNKI